MKDLSGNKSFDGEPDANCHYRGVGIQALSRFLTPGSSVLEIGMGLGEDLEILEQKYQVTGSDNSQSFLDMYRSKRPDADLMNLDAISLNTNRRFDCIYSNKVLHLIDRNKLKDSFYQQHKLLRQGGIICHTMWYGDKAIDVKGQRMHYYNERTILDFLGSDLVLLEAGTYQEMIENDSMLLVLRKA